MKNQREIYEALLAGETLIHNDPDYKVEMVGDRIEYERGSAPPNFYSPEDWEIYKEPKWYENIPDGGVLCWNLDAVGTQSDYVSRIDNNVVANMGKYKPLTKQEIQVFMDNAPEEV